ncbi:dinitrogenase iron-molybdenum cofactor biosynthesis protein [Desulfovibrio aerotolerans]|uniref:Dinitrogenase iron-molybdenum cofactor biosynthesis protein n=1 Tax=Solidesulfovibrio aerotolerans TaxID=295255 RepID=A0A7C9MVC9_9BACT|nr:dinitrogenase iron-molybdenum cofactor biosynthesis protein [Solidesulfovibrio aerotolerans]MYL83494.1 dinitrogenase iron-molybdenum cofactor biosynthesis protein [Solidesulfovibrio aerotolerans]
MSGHRVLIALRGNEVAWRFDKTAEALVCAIDDDGTVTSQSEIIFACYSAEDLCEYVLAHNIDTVVAGGMEEEYYHYLRWKRVDVIDNVAGELGPVLERLAGGRLSSGDILFPQGEG